MAITLLYTLLRTGPTGTAVINKAIVVCPSTLVPNWSREFKKWLGTERLNPMQLEASKSKEEQQQDIAAFVAGQVNQVLIIGYEMFRKVR